ncbi:MAG: hypothetical protein AAFS11_03210 [Planctomycetota bacterium]
METGPSHLAIAGTPVRRVEPTHHAAWPVQRPRPFDEALASSNERQRDADRVEFSDEVRRLNEEQRLRDLRCDEAECGESATAEPVSPPTRARPAELPPEASEIVRTVEHPYEVTHRSTTGRLIDMLM